jgi:two-component system, LuxR family, sensor kinase FixL
LPDAGKADEVAALRAELARLRADHDRLRESEKMYRFASEISGRLVWATDAEGKIRAMSRMFGLLTGVADEQALIDGWLQSVHPDDRARIESLWHRALETGETFAADFRALLADGSSRKVLSRAVPIRDKAGRITRWYGSTEDVEAERSASEARAAAEERLRESEELYRHTLELSQQIVWTADADGKVDYLSSRFADITGLPPGTTPGDAIHPDDLASVAERWRASVETGAAHVAEYRLRMCDGGYRLVRSRAAPRRDEAGRVVRWYGTTEDIHDQRQADLARREAEERYRLAARATNDAIWDYDIVQGVVEWSEAAGDILGCRNPPGRTAIGWWEERIHPEDRLKVVDSLTEAVEGKQSRWSATYRFRRDDGSFADMLDRGFIIRAPDGTAVRAVGAIADLTERLRAEAELRRMQAELVHVSRVSAMGTMASTLAHELNQPLTAVTNYLRAARRFAFKGDEDRPMLLEALDLGEQAGLRAGEIVRRLRELVARGTVSVVQEHLPTLIEEAGVLGFLDETLLGFTHRFDLDPEAQWVLADRIQIQQVLINLIRNGVEAMRESERREIAIITRAAGNMVELRVEDTGCGIPPENMDSLFSHFMTTKTEGMGIGLPISRTIVEAHGGRIWAENRAEGGAVFCFTLPRARPRGEGIDPL